MGLLAELLALARCEVSICRCGRVQCIRAHLYRTVDISGAGGFHSFLNMATIGCACGLRSQFEKAITLVSLWASHTAYYAMPSLCLNDEQRM